MAGADRLEANSKDHTRTFDGRVELQQDGARLRADHVKVFSNPASNDQGGSGWGDVQRIEAEGNIYYVTEDQTIKGDHLVYTKDNNTMIISGDVILTQGQNVLTGNRMVYNESTGESTMDANPVNASTKGRVKGVFYPDNGKKPKG